MDFYTYNDWEFSAKSDAQIEVLKKVDQTDLAKAPNVFMSWLYHWDPATKTKTSANGFCVYGQDTQEVYLSIDDPQRGISDEWALDTQHCKNAGPKKPVFIAANVDLTLWQ